MTASNQTASKTTVTGIDLSYVLTGDPKRSIAFYTEVLGLVPTEVDPEGRGAEFTLSDGSSFGVWCPDGGGEAKGAGVMFAVADAKAAVAEFRSRGAQLGDVDETPACFMSFGADPDGNAICIHQRKVPN